MYDILLEGFNIKNIARLGDFQEITLEFKSNLEKGGQAYLYQNSNNEKQVKLFYLSPLNSISEGHSSEQLLKTLIDPQSVWSLNDSNHKVEVKAVIYS